MAVTTTIEPKVSPILPRITTPYEKVFPIAEWTACGQATGDVSAGTVKIIFPVKKAAVISNWFYVINRFYAETGDVTAGKHVTIRLPYTDWKIFADTVLNFPVYNAALNIETTASIAQRDAIVEPIYLGQPTQAQTGEIWVLFENNDNAKIYGVYMSGVIYAQSPLTTKKFIN